MAAALYDRIYLFCDEQIKYYPRIFRPIGAIVRDLEKCRIIPAIPIQVRVATGSVYRVALQLAGGAHKC